MKGEPLEMQVIMPVVNKEIDYNPLPKLNDFKNNTGKDIRFHCQVKQINGSNYNSASLFIDNVLSKIV
jgi:hypothetical protein